MKRFVDPHSAPSTKSELDLFSLPPTQVAIKRAFMEQVHPTNPIVADGPFEFRIPADPHFLNLAKHYIYFQMRIVRPDGTNLTAQAAENNPADPLVAPINLIGKTLFKQVKLFLNSRLVYDSGDKYHYRAYLETELNFGADAKMTHLASALYTHDADENDMDRQGNEGFAARAARFANSAWVELCCPLHFDLSTQERYILPHTETRLELHRNPDNLILLCYAANPRNYRIEIREMKLFVQKIEVLESINLALEATLAHHTAKYPLRRTVVTSLHVSAQRRATPMNNIFQGQIPRRMIVACCDNDAYHGQINSTPFNFKHYGIQSIKVVAGGQSFPAYPLHLDFANRQYLQAYMQLHEALGQAGDNKSCMITLEAYRHSACIFGFDLTDDADDGAHWDIVREGNTSLEIQFGPNLPQNGVQVIIYAEFDNLLTLDRNRYPHFDFTA